MSYEQWSESDLMAAVVERDKAAYRAFVDRYQARVFRLTRSLSGTDADAEDAMQETFLAVWRSAAGFSKQNTVKAWVFTIARNAALRLHRRRVGEPVGYEPLSVLGAEAGWGVEAEAGPEDAAVASERCVLLHNALMALSEADREVILLRDIEELTGPQACEMLDVPLATMKTRLHRARLRLMAKLRPEAGV